ncbi:imidazole glycerol phosphate synthase subunit HisF [Hyphomicrobium sp. xq]|uniref:Imidazole glycerol phosphate synthase subunit HisF n=1 Tax=Hyphomicrobium album TaxID=2665159 RepID=A0A6I3KJS0_9HYPH|nr:imidazole glycerol phosphate synthase cyclase subunit [Hyphomicrobium album]MTD94669.1 imidazole glycerol phosphate synthase subunit HisF [Hyphomicrobium album]
MQRLIARLDVKNGIVIKGIHLEGQRRIGAPVELAANYYAQGVDEVLFMDSVASLYGRSNLFDTITEACKQVFVPITIGGGLRSVEDVELALAAGADKVAVNSALVRTPELATQIATLYGRQCLVASIEAKRVASGWEAYISNGREPTGRDVLDWVRELERRGAGEILLTSVDQEGTQRGFDIELCEAVEKAVRIPIVASGGAGKVRHLSQLDQTVHLQGIAIASLLHYGKATVAELKSALSDAHARKWVGACSQ